jgi:hypothetical protein
MLFFVLFIPAFLELFQGGKKREEGAHGSWSTSSAQPVEIKEKEGSPRKMGPK